MKRELIFWEDQALDYYYGRVLVVVEINDAIKVKAMQGNKFRMYWIVV